MEKLNIGDVLSQTNPVGVFMSEEDVDHALVTRPPVSFYEWRLDCYNDRSAVVSAITKLNKPLILTVRSPHEGGTKNWNRRTRALLYHQYMRDADFIDVEASSLFGREPMCDVVLRAKKEGRGVIVSFHDFKETPHPHIIGAAASIAGENKADVFKVATKVNNLVELSRLVEFFSKDWGNGRPLPVAAMAMGSQFGAISLVLFGIGKSPFVYGYLSGVDIVPGQIYAGDIRRRMEEFVPY